MQSNAYSVIADTPVSVTSLTLRQTKRTIFVRPETARQSPNVVNHGRQFAAAIAIANGQLRMGLEDLGPPISILHSFWT